MPLASKVTKDVILPTDPKIHVTIRKLGWTAQKLARQTMVQESSRNFIAMGGVDAVELLQRAMPNMGLEERAAAVANAPTVERTEPFQTETVMPPVTVVPEVDLLALYDPLEVLVGGVKSWSYPQSVTRETLGDLDVDDAEFLAREILALTIPAKVTEEQEKN